MKKGSSVSPVLLELVIVILFFALSSSAVLQLIAAAANTSRESEKKSSALIAAIDIMEGVRQDPTQTVFAPPIKTQAGDELTFTVKVAGAPNGTGTLYDISVEAFSGEETLVLLTDCKYVSGGAGG